MMRERSLLGSLVLCAAAAAAPSIATAFDVVLQAQGEYLDAYLTEPLRHGNHGSIIFPAGRYAFVVPDDPAHGGRHLNGNVCFFPPGVGHDGQFVAADDVFDEACNAEIGGGPADRCTPEGEHWVGDDPPGWAIMNEDGSWGGRVIHAVGCGPNGQGGPCDLEGASLGTRDPQGCFFDRRGNLWGTDVGADGDFTNTSGALLVFFAEGDYTDYCVVADSLPSPAMPAYDGRNILLPLSGAGTVLRLTDAPLLGFPRSRADCPDPDRKVKTPPLTTVFTMFPLSLTATPAQIVRKPRTKHWYMASVLAPPAIFEYGALGLISGITVKPLDAKNPIGLDVASNGEVWFSELNLQNDAVAGEVFTTGCGSLSKAKPGHPPVLVASGLRFPDGVTIIDSSRLDLRGLQPPLILDPASCAPE